MLRTLRNEAEELGCRVRKIRAGGQRFSSPLCGKREKLERERQHKEVPHDARALPATREGAHLAGGRCREQGARRASRRERVSIARCHGVARWGEAVGRSYPWRLAAVFALGGAPITSALVLPGGA